ncbi:MAG: hypothetical protein Q8O12_03340 [Candidatus Omnitrophota bacterium]|nr:hypothetical protein [Candidatus Omnitrophota bacterium]
MEKAKKLILSILIVFIAMPIYAADEALKPIDTPATPVIYYPVHILMIKPVEYTNFSDWVNTAKKDTEDDNDTLRAEWKQALGVDIFYLHFKAKEITHKIEEKSKFRLFNMRGRAKIKEDSATYTFSHKF